MCSYVSPLAHSIQEKILPIVFSKVMMGNTLGDTTQNLRISLLLRLRVQLRFRQLLWLRSLIRTWECHPRIISKYFNFIFGQLFHQKKARIRSACHFRKNSASSKAEPLFLKLLTITSACSWLNTSWGDRKLELNQWKTSNKSKIQFSIPKTKLHDLVVWPKFGRDLIRPNHHLNFNIPLVGESCKSSHPVDLVWIQKS